MRFDVFDKLKELLKNAKERLRQLGFEKTQKAMYEFNLLLLLLKNAGYEVSQVEIELRVPPRITIHLKASSAVSEEKLSAILRDNRDKKVLAGIVMSLIQANKLRGSVKVEGLGLEDMKILLATAPNIVMQWKEKAVRRASA